MRQSGRSFSSYFILLIILMAIVIGLGWAKNPTASYYSREDFIKDVEAGNVTEVDIHPNTETPTGYLVISRTNAPDRTLYVTDVSAAEEMVRSYGIACNQQIVYDVSTYRSQVTAFIGKINRCELAPVHLKDCIYDFLCTL